MKKLTKNFVVLASSFFLLTSSLFVSCANDVGDDDTPAKTIPSDQDQGQKPVDNTKPGDTTKPGDETKPGDTTKPGDDTVTPDPVENPDPVTNPGEETPTEVDHTGLDAAPDLSTYYKYYLVKAGEDGRTIADWGSGSTPARNEDKTWTITAAEHMWPQPDNPNTVGGIAAPFTGFEAGTFANYEYIVFTVDTTDFVIDYSKLEGNYGVNVKVPDPQRNVNKLYVADEANEKLQTYYVSLSEFEGAPATATEFAIIIGGSGRLTLKEVYLAAQEDPNTKAITGITISPATGILLQNGTQQFTVKDSNFEVRTGEVTYALSGDAAVGSTITNEGLLTVGTTAGDITVTATYTVGGKNFTAETSVKVYAGLTNVLNTISHRDGQLPVEDNKDGSFTVTSNGAGGTWGAQVFFTVDPECLASLTDGKTVIVAVDLETETNVNAFMKMQVNNGYAGIDNNTSIPAIAAGEKKTVIITGTLGGVVSNELVVLLDLRDTEAGKTITLSNFQVFDITE